MSWPCPKCGYSNSDAFKDCACGYELGKDSSPIDSKGNAGFWRRWGETIGTGKPTVIIITLWVLVLTNMYFFLFVNGLNAIALVFQSVLLVALHRQWKSRFLLLKVWGILLIIAGSSSVLRLFIDLLQVALGHPYSEQKSVVSPGNIITCVIMLVGGIWVVVYVEKTKNEQPA